MLAQGSCLRHSLRQQIRRRAAERLADQQGGFVLAETQRLGTSHQRFSEREDICRTRAADGSDRIHPVFVVQSQDLSTRCEQRFGTIQIRVGRTGAFA